LSLRRPPGKINWKGQASLVGRSDNIIRTKAAAEELRREFIGWQCRLRQLAAREDGGRPSAGMRPRALTLEGYELSPGILVLMVESKPEMSTSLFRHQYLRTQDPKERYEKALQILQSGYFQQPAQFSDVLSALFGPDSAVAARLRSHGRCLLEFAQYAAGYRIPCRIDRLAEADASYQATYWHSRLFSPNLPSGIEILAFTPDWAHAARDDTKTRLDE
jgi:hypothetical protein